MKSHRETLILSKAAVYLPPFRSSRTFLLPIFINNGVNFDESRNFISLRIAQPPNFVSFFVIVSSGPSGEQLLFSISCRIFFKNQCDQKKSVTN